MGSKDSLRDVLEEFVDKLDSVERLNSREIEKILKGEKSDLAGKDLASAPEAFTEDNLIWPVMETLGWERDSRYWGKGDWPDFKVLNFDTKVIGENKPLNNIEEAIENLKGNNGYLNKKTVGADYGIATDGFTWKIIKIEIGGDFLEFKTVGEFDLRPIIAEIAREKDYIVFKDLKNIDIEEDLAEIESEFSSDSLNRTLTVDFPQKVKEERQKDISEFFDLYIELLFGEGSNFDYETTLLEDIDAPESATEKDKRIFSVTLVNRLLFIRFLEDKGVIPSGFLRSRVDDYQEYSDKLPINLYDSQLKPLFYKILNTKKENRNQEYRKDPFNEIPYLNGGLFRENVKNEDQYSVKGRILPILISDLIEGTELSSQGEELDPSVIGSVFEKTINHITQNQGLQKDIGAYYTPNDVTTLILNETIDPKAKDILVEAYSKEYSDEIKSKINSLDLEEILRRIEEGEGWFGDPNAAERALEELKDMKVLDPACGSGHFLTSALDEIFRIKLSLLKGLNRGENPSDKEIYSHKKEIALHSIYGIDIEKVGTEIAKLRVWLKIVEEGWNEDFGKLPNIEVNIESGNSLVGFPLAGSLGDTTLKIGDIKEEMENLEETRMNFKYQDEVPDEARLTDIELEDKLGRRYVSFLNFISETEISSRSELEDLFDNIEVNNVYNVIEEIKVEKKDGSELSDGEKNLLDDEGIKTHTKSARIYVERFETQRKAKNSNGGSDKNAREFLLYLLEHDFIFSEVKRRPTMYDLRSILGDPIHWPIKFPEVAESDSKGYDINFDVIVGNPPYGDILSDSEKILLNNHITIGVNDVVAQFVERQIQLLAEDGYYGNITNLRLVYDSNIPEFHKLLRNNLAETRISCFERRPSQVFKNAQVQVGIITGQKNPKEGSIKTSKFIRFNKDDRSEKLNPENISYEDTEGLILNDKINGDSSDRYKVLPKVGEKETKNILHQLESNKKTINSEVCEDGYTVFRQRGGGYRPIAMIDKLYSSGSIQPIELSSELNRDLVFLIVNSSLFYLFWMVYGDAHHVNTGQIKRFPLPSEEKVESKANDITELKDVIDQQMREVLDKDNNYIYMSKIKEKIHEIDDLLAELYELSDSQVEFVKNYHSKYIWTKS